MTVLVEHQNGEVLRENHLHQVLFLNKIQYLLMAWKFLSSVLTEKLLTDI